MEGQKLWCVYMHTTPSNKRYIGITSNKLSIRWGHSGHNYHRNRRFYSAIVHYGWENIKHEVIYKNLSEQEAKETERRLIREYRSNELDYGYNMTSGGDGTCGRHRTEEEKEAIRRGHLGKPLSEETKRKISQGNKGKTRHGAKIGRPKGYKLSEESKRQISEKCKKYTPWNKGLKLKR